MPATIDFRKESPQGLAALYQLEKHLKDSGLDPLLLHRPRSSG